MVADVQGWLRHLPPALGQRPDNHGQQHLQRLAVRRRLREVRDHIRGEKFAGLGIVPSISFDQQVDSSVLVLPDQIDGLGHGAASVLYDRRRSNQSAHSAVALRAQ
jgi:hypothetical protein